MLVKNIYQEIRYEQSEIEGQVRMGNTYGDVSKWDFIPPVGRNHSIQLK